MVPENNFSKYTVDKPSYYIRQLDCFKQITILLPVRFDPPRLAQKDRIKHLWVLEHRAYYIMWKHDELRSVLFTTKHELLICLFNLGWFWKEKIRV